MSSRSLYADLHLNNREETIVSWHYRLLNYLLCMFRASIRGSFFFCKHYFIFGVLQFLNNDYF